MRKKHKNYEDSLFEALKDRQEALSYLNAAIMDEDQRVFLLALRDVLIANGITNSTIIKKLFLF